MRIEKLRQLNQIDIQNQWKPSPLTRIPQGEGNKGYITWNKGRELLILTQKIVIPEHINNYPIKGLSLRLILTWWAEKAEIFINDNLVQVGDLFDSSVRLLLTPHSLPGTEINIKLGLISPIHAQGALMKSICLYESNYPLDSHIDPTFFADELTILQDYLPSDFLASQLELIDFDSLPDLTQFNLSLEKIQQNILNSNVSLPNHTIDLLGHSHLDLAWLWNVNETWQVAQNTFTSVLNLQNDFPDLIFAHSTPALYLWIENNRPNLFAEITEKVRLGKWEIIGGMWVEPDLILINGESIVRHILYGQRYIKEKFGYLMNVAWLPDSFGFTWQLPQFLTQGKIDYFVTQKLTWNDTTRFPYPLFFWESPDGSHILSLMSSPIGEGIDGVKINKYDKEWQEKTNISSFLWLPGVGDHGGGPTREMLELKQRWQKSDFFPNLEFTTAKDYLEKIKKEEDKIPVWNDELYLEFHRGCYTSHGDQKRYNRECEGLLYQAELLASLGKITVNYDYPTSKLENAWKQVLFNQFHDILPGTSITEVFTDANINWQEVQEVTKEIIKQSLGAIASQINLPQPPHFSAMPFMVFNPLNWSRSEVVILDTIGQIYDVEGNCLEVQKEGEKLLFFAQNIPSVGYKVFWFIPEQISPRSPKPNPAGEGGIEGEIHLNQEELIPPSPPFPQERGSEGNFILENEYLRVIVDEKTGNLMSVYDRINNREILAKPQGNELQAFTDQGQYWDAWNIDPKYAQYPLSPTELKSIKWLEFGQIRKIIRVIKLLGKSEFCQDYILDKNSPILQIKNQVNWLEDNVLVKASFPLNINAKYATYEIACGAIEREIDSEIKWEVPALKWADLSDDYGVSLLNDCKYGYDVKNGQLRLTLLRSPKFPDPECDRGFHQFTYSLYPHIGTWQKSHTVRKGYELNIPLQVQFFDINKEGKLSPISSCLNLGSENLILMALKQSEDEENQFILRCYECHGEDTELRLTSDLNIEIKGNIDLLEMTTETPVNLHISKWKIASFVLYL